jgi:hypothetical protein
MNVPNINGAFVVDVSEEELLIISTYLQSGKTPDEFEPYLFRYFQIPLPEEDVPLEFFRIQMKEKWQRTMTIDDPQVDKHVLKHVAALIPVVAPVRDNLLVRAMNPYFALNERLINPNDNISLRVAGVDIDLYGGRLVLAGGSLVSSLVGAPIKDFDLFFVGVKDKNEALEIVTDFLRQAIKGRRLAKLILSKNSWTMKFKDHKTFEKRTIQFIFRSYKNIDEIMLGFDVDCCAMVYDGKEIYLSERCLYSFRNHLLTVDFDRMSPTYEYRLAKYLNRGFDLYVPGIDISHIHFTTIAQLKKKYNSVNIDPVTGEMTLWSKYSRTATLQDSSSTLTTPPIVQTLPGETSLPLMQPKIKAKKTVISGLDALLYLCFGAISELQKISVSDYSLKVLSSQNGVKRFEMPLDPNHPRAEMVEGLYLAGAWMVLETSWYTFGDDQACNSLMQRAGELAVAKGVDIEWITENPGHQITSSFHALVHEDREKWYDGTLYGKAKAPVKAEIRHYLDL